MSAEEWIEKLQLQPHPEGGAFKENYRSVILHQTEFDQGEKALRNLCTAIYYLLREGECSVFHRILSDELWHHYDGGDLLIYCLDPLQGMQIIRLGKNHPEALPQFCVQAGIWFASRPDAGAGFVLAGCTVAPGFDFNDFELAKREDLLGQYPMHSEEIVKLTL
jgi:hypothetical protein